MKASFALVLCVLLQWNPTISCSGCGPVSTQPQALPPYDLCANGACANPTPKCGPVGLCTTASACASDADCPRQPGVPGAQPREGICVRLAGLNGGAAFCTTAAKDADDECIGGGWDFHGTSAFTHVGATSGEKRYACLPASFGCGDGECGLFSESVTRCPIDCLYRSCVPNGWEEPGSSCNRADYSVCIDVGVPDGGQGDAGFGVEPRFHGICVASGQETCAADGGCLARAGFAGVCVSSLSFSRTCMQSCAKNADCLFDQRCVPTPDAGVSVCLPWASRF